MIAKARKQKTLVDTSAEDRLDLIFRALGDRTRRALLARLALGPAKITELAQPLDMSLPGASKHLRVLEKAGLVERSVDGRIHQCSLRAEPMQEIEAWLSEYRTFWNESLQSLANS